MWSRIIYHYSFNINGMRAMNEFLASGNFKLWLRAYLPGPAILNGTYQMPPV